MGHFLYHLLCVCIFFLLIFIYYYRMILCKSVSVHFSKSKQTTVFILLCTSM